MKNRNFVCSTGDLLADRFLFGSSEKQAVHTALMSLKAIYTG